jgi:mannan endo-1,4-beta-mannosidase
MKTTLRVHRIVGMVVGAALMFSCWGYNPPVSPGASPEARAVLRYLYDISGTGILGGVHGQNWDPYAMPELVEEETGTYPAFYSGDFRYGNDLDNRRRMVVEAARDHWKNGTSIVSLMWHVTPPLEENTAGWERVQSSRLTPEQTDSLLTPGNRWYEAWMAKLDEIAGYLEELRQEGVPVLWRPFHEMNGGWFWWGKNARFDEMWIQMFERFTDHHGLDNLLWVWSPNCVVYGAGELIDYYPGHDYVDILAEDIYANKSYDWEQYFYDDLMELAEGRPIAMGEVGDLPDPQFVKEHQPNWCMFMLWPGYQHQYANNPERNAYVYTHDYTITSRDLPQSLFTAAPVLTAGFTLTPARPGPAPAVVNVDGAESTPGEEPIESYEWDFGDGATAGGVTARHTYQSNGTYTITLTLTDVKGATRSSSQSVFVGEVPPKALFVADGGSGDQAVTARLESLGYEVVTGSGGTADATEVDLVLISSTINSSTVGESFTDAAVPVIVWEPYLFDDMGMTGATADSDFGTDENASAVNIITAGHELAAGLPAGETAAGTAVTYGVPGTEAAIVATLPGDPSRSTVFAYEQGDVMVAGSAPARRVGFYFSDNTAASLDGEEWALFDAAVDWATGSGMTDASVSRMPEGVARPAGTATIMVVDDQVRIELPGEGEYAEVCLYAANGTTVRRHRLTAAHNRLALEHLARGIYLVTLERGGRIDRRVVVVR